MGSSRFPGAGETDIPCPRHCKQLDGQRENQLLPEPAWEAFAYISGLPVPLRDGEAIQNLLAMSGGQMSRTDDNNASRGYASGLDFIFSQRGHPLLVVDNFLYRKNRGHYWRCIRCTKFKCRSRLIVKPGQKPARIEDHSHGPETEKISWGRTVMENVKSHEQGDIVFRMRQPHCKVDYVINPDKE
ncbi:uncharacterized protein LOC115264271 [Aedes albopictus]|uniref:FLYWCH-type domain-containing protein n=1 Tax=Aedes albopictus TaxID=7160 RepID=A0ABM1Z345_AEDAL